MPVDPMNLSKNLFGYGNYITALFIQLSVGNEEEMEIYRLMFGKDYYQAIFSYNSVFSGLFTRPLCLGPLAMGMKNIITDK